MPDGVQAVDWMCPTRRPNASIAALVCHARAAACSFTPIKNIPRYEDFHFAYVEGDTANAAWYDERGISCFTYTEPSSWWMHLKGKGGNLPTYAECVAEVARLAAEAPSVDAAAWSKHAA